MFVGFKTTCLPPWSGPFVWPLLEKNTSAPCIPLLGQMWMFFLPFWIRNKTEDGSWNGEQQQHPVLLIKAGTQLESRGRGSGRSLCSHSHKRQKIISCLAPLSQGRWKCVILACGRNKRSGKRRSEEIVSVPEDVRTAGLICGVFSGVVLFEDLFISSFILQRLCLSERKQNHWSVPNVTSRVWSSRQ